MARVARQEKTKNFWPSFWRLVGTLKLQRFKVAFAFGFAILSTLLRVFIPIMLGLAIDQIYDGVTTSSTIDFPALNNLLLGILALYFAGSCLDFLSGYLLNKAVMQVVFRLREHVANKVNQLPLSYFDTAKRGDLISRTTNDIDNMQTALQQGFSQMMGAITQILAIVVIMFILNWQLALIALISIPLTGVIVGIVGVRAQKLYQKQWSLTGDLNAHIEDTFSGHEIMRAFNRDDELLAEFREHNQKLRDNAIKANTLSFTIFPATQFVNYLVYVLIAVVGAIKVVNQSITLGQVVAFIKYAQEFSEPVGEMARVAGMIQSGVASAERVFEILDEPEEAPDSTTAELNLEGQGEVEFDSITFSYRSDKPLFEDFKLSVDPGQTVAIVGPTGAGKTSLVNLIMRFYEPQAGRILLDGVDIASVPRAELRSRVGMVLQDAFLFTGTIMENIRYGRLEASDDEVIQAAKATMVDNFVRQLPAGYQTMLEENGSSLSAGERQLITIARAFLAKPSLLILDEATSSVDTRTELLIQQALTKLRKGRTSFVIAHRLSTIKDADVIMMMQNGKVVEQGSHEELVSARGPYYELLKAQFGGAMMEVDELADFRP